MKTRILLILLISVFFVGKGYSDDLPERAKVSVTMRKIGNAVLLDSGDSTSRVLPVKSIGQNKFIISFERPFCFDPTQLVYSIHRYIKQDRLPDNYLVEVLEGSFDQIVYSYIVDGSPEKSDIPCLERIPPKGNYSIRIIFENTDSPPFSYSSLYPLLIIPCIAMFFLIGWKAKRASKREPGPGMRASYEDLFKIAIGDFSFYPERQLLKHLSGSEELSSKESKLLKIFAESPNEIVDRDRLLKEVWEDEGVIVGRSLDVFVSKLRKRLQADETVKLVSVHGRGYKLEVQNSLQNQ